MAVTKTKYFEAPAGFSTLPIEPPDNLTVPSFLFDEEKTQLRHPLATSKPPFTCGITGKTYRLAEASQRYQALARSISAELGWAVNTGTELDKAAAIFSLNSIDYLTVCWAIHRLSGVACPISTAYTIPQLTAQLQATSCQAIFASAPHIDAAIEAAAAVGIPRNRVYVVDVPEEAAKGTTPPEDLKTVNQLIDEGMKLGELPAVEWEKGQGARQTAYICPSSGTGGLPKNVMITHKNVISNVLQWHSREQVASDYDPGYALGVLPQYHSFALLGTSHVNIYRGMGVVILPSFDMNRMLSCVQEYQIHELWLIPPLIIGLIHAASMLDNYDLSSVKAAWVGSSSLGRETLDKARALLPNCLFCQGYGLTEHTFVISVTPRDDFMLGSCGTILPGTQARLLGANGETILEYDEPGELVVSSTSVVPGYLNNEAAMRESLTEDGWLRTGDLVEMRKSEKGNTHIFHADRIKELIKVHSTQVAPAEIENSLLLHPFVSEICVVPLPDDEAGEVPRAYVVLAASAKNKDEVEIRAALKKHVDDNFSMYKRLAGGIEILESLPRTGSGKVQRNALRERARAFAKERKDRMGGGEGDGGAKGEVFDFDSDNE